MQAKRQRRMTLGRFLRSGWIVACLFLVACHVDMYDQPRYEANEPSDFFEDGRSMRPPVPNTIAIGEYQGDSAFLTGRTADGFAENLPVELNQTLMARGQKEYNSFCLPCHGVLGDGNGIIAQRGPLLVTSLHEDRLRQAPVGYIFDVITNGVGRMYSYGHRVRPEDRWAITAYVRALQLSQDGSVDDVPPQELERLETDTQANTQ